MTFDLFLYTKHQNAGKSLTLLLCELTFASLHGQEIQASEG